MKSQVLYTVSMWGNIAGEPAGGVWSLLTQGVGDCLGFDVSQLFPRGGGMFQHWTGLFYTSLPSPRVEISGSKLTHALCFLNRPIVTKCGWKNTVGISYLQTSFIALLNTWARTTNATTLVIFVIASCVTWLRWYVTWFFHATGKLWVYSADIVVAGTSQWRVRGYGVN